MAGKGTPATALLTRHGVEHTAHEYTHDPRSRAYGDEAAEALGVEAQRIFKTLVASVDGGRLVLAVVPVAASLDLKALAVALGAKRAALADPAAAERATGYVRGGISPLGGRKRLPVVIDVGAQALPTMFVSGGRRGLQVELAPADLVAVAGASVHAIAVA